MAPRGRDRVRTVCPTFIDTDPIYLPTSVGTAGFETLPPAASPSVTSLWRDRDLGIVTTEVTVLEDPGHTFIIRNFLRWSPSRRSQTGPGDVRSDNGTKYRQKGRWTDWLDRIRCRRGQRLGEVSILQGGCRVNLILSLS